MQQCATLSSQAGSSCTAAKGAGWMVWDQLQPHGHQLQKPDMIPPSLAQKEEMTISCGL